MSVYKLLVDNPQSETGKKIFGEVRITKSGPMKQAIGSLGGLPYPFTDNNGNVIKNTPDYKDLESGKIGPIEGDKSSSIEESLLVSNMVSRLASIVTDIYSMNTVLISELITDTPVVADTPTTPGSTASDPTTSSGVESNTQNTDPKTINTKVTLTVKSGPGVLIGINEKEVIDGVVDFSGIQFDTAGDYVISVTPTSTDLEGTEFNITISPEEDVIPQDGSKEEEKVVTGDRPGITQIDKPTITLPPIEFDTTPNKRDNNEIGFGLGFTPFFWYNGVQIPERDIKSLELYHEGIIPNVSITFIDTLDVMRKDGFPLEDTKFEIFLNSGSDNLKSIHLRFKLKNFQENKRKSYTIIGTLDLDSFYKVSYKSYTGTSFESIKTISSELKIGFNSNISNTLDSMKWANTGMLPSDFISNIIKHSYISDASFMLGYIDHYYCFNYVDIEKEWNRDISNDVGVDSQGISSQQGGAKSDEEKLRKIVLSNDPADNNTSFYFISYNVNNNATQQVVEKGNYTVTKSYDSNAKSFLIFDVDSLTSNNDSTIVLKGKRGDNKSYKENFRTKYGGRTDMDNLHKNYYYSEIQNRVNLDNIVKVTVDMVLPQANYNLYKYQKIQINFLNLRRTLSSDTFLNERISGEWIIIDIRYIWKKGKLTQNIKAARKELSKLTSELNDPVIQEKTVSNSEINENPVVNTNPPNSVYVVGEVYKVVDKNGKLYQVTIDKLSENGKEVVASLKEL